MKEQIFKVGDTVYCWELAGKEPMMVVNIIKENQFGVKVEYNNNVWWFDALGRVAASSINPILSLTPYDLVNGGFSQERPLPKIEVDTLVFVRASDKHTWIIRYFSHFKDGICFCFDNQKTSKKAERIEGWSFWSLENPLLK